MKIFKIIFNLCRVADQKPKRLFLKDVKPGDRILVEWDKIKGKIGGMVCLNNDPETKKIFLQVKWSNYKEQKCTQLEQIVLDYNSKELANFHLLNADTKQTAATERPEIDILVSQLQEAIAKENYEKAEELRKKIEKLKG